jgi:hypothetical protein
VARLVRGDHGLLLQHDDLGIGPLAGEQARGRQADDPSLDHYDSRSAPPSLTGAIFTPIMRSASLRIHDWRATRAPSPWRRRAPARAGRRHRDLCAGRRFGGAALVPLRVAGRTETFL